MNMFVLFLRSETQHRGSAPHSESDLPEQEEEILGSDDDEQEDPNDYCKGKIFCEEILSKMWSTYMQFFMWIFGLSA